MKKNIAIISILLLVTSATFSQKIETIDYGLDYYKLKDIGYLDFKMDCMNGWYPSSLENDAIYKRSGYANSNFQATLKTKDYQLSKLYNKEIKDLGEEFHKYHNRLYSGFKSGSKKAFKYMKLHFEKFEIISEYYKDLYNYKIEKSEQDKLIAAKMDSISKATSSIINHKEAEIDNDKELIKIKKSKQISLESISAEFDAKINQLETEKKDKIASLDMTNYTERKTEIANEYDPKIAVLKTEKSSRIEDTEAYWDDKISNRIEELNAIIANETSSIENKQVQTQNAVRENTKSINQLEDSLTQIEENYENSLNEINSKINELFGK